MFVCSRCEQLLACDLRELVLRAWLCPCASSSPPGKRDIVLIGKRY